MDEPQRIQPNDSIERSRKAVAAHRLNQQKKKHFREVVIAASLLAMLLYLTNFYMSDDPIKQQLAACDEYDKKCHAENLLNKVEGECSNRITRPLRYEFEWTDSLTTPRFRSADWYVPGKSIIFTGSELKVANLFGAKVRAQYFCVASISTGFVIKAGIASQE